MAYIYSLADTWADGATTFKGISLNVTDTASAADSMLMDLQVGGASLLRMFKNGELRISTSTGFFTTGSSGTNSMIFGNPAISSAPAAIQTGVGLTLKSDVGFAWSNGAVNGTRDTILARDAANTLAQRNGVNAQAFNLYNTYTDASNYERGFMRFVSNVLEIGAERAGTGSNRGTRIISPGGNLALQAGTAPWEIRLTTAGHLAPASGNNQDCGDASNTWRNMYQAGFKEYVETTAPAAPATNRVRIYAEDNGSGKTRLMALFPTGVAQQIAIEP